MWKCSLVIGILLGGLWVGIQEVRAQMVQVSPYQSLPSKIPAYQVVVREAALRVQVPVQVEAGRSASIDFSPTGERIVFINLADPSRIVYRTNLPVSSGRASTVFITPIQYLGFPGATTTPVTNLQVQTVEPGTNRLRLYTFNVVHVSSATVSGIVITPQPVFVARRPVKAALSIADQTPLNVDAIEQGLEISIQQGYTPIDDPVVSQVRLLIAQVRSGLPILFVVRRSTDLPLSVIQALNQIGYREVPIDPFPAKPTSTP